MAGQTSNMDQFEVYFQRADVDRDGRISGSEAVTFLQASNLPRPVLAQIWTYADQNRSGFLSRSDFYNALKLVTVAQSKRDLTPEIVKAALYSPASDKIPAPQINLAATQGPRPNVMSSPSTAQSGGVSSPIQGIGAVRPPGVLDQPSHVARPPRPPLPSSGLQSHVGSTHGIPGKGSMSVPNPPGVVISSQASGTNLLPSMVQSSLAPGGSPPSQSISPLLQSGASTPNSALWSLQASKEDTRAPSAAGNGFAPGSVPGADTSSSLRGQHSGKHNAAGQTPSAQPLPDHGSGKESEHVLPQTPSTVPVAAGNSVSPQPESPWPRMTQSDVQKYIKVFMQVDADRDGKITGEQARNLFLSWKLPREVLKQVWDLSDQDNDSMLSLREFCIALYLMERYREGRSLPKVLPNSIMFDETSLPASGQPTMQYGNASWRPSPGFQQPQGTRNVRPTSVAGGRPPRPVPVPQPDEPIIQKPKVPELEKHLVDQLSTEEQDSLNKRFQEAKDAEKKVADLEKEILEAKQKIQFYHTKMQELIIYKSRCDSRLNEISEKVVGYKREAEALAKKYEEKYKQVGDVASKLTFEEATFREIQGKKMELYRAVVKLEEEKAESVKDRADQIQSDLEELVKTLNEQCKTYGLHTKPTTLVELPFGWQLGIEVNAADWDEAWDKFEDEAYTYAKELTLDIENVGAPPKPKTPLVREKVIQADERGAKNAPSMVNEPSELSSSEERVHKNERLNAHNTQQTAKSPPDSPTASSGIGSPYENLPQLRMPKEATFDGSPRGFDTQSEFGGTESVGMGSNEPGWGSFDTHFDSDAAWDHNPVTSMGAEQERNGEDYSFGVDVWGLNPIKTGSTGITAKQGPFFDSVPSTPLYSSSNSPQKKQSPFFDSVPSTPLYSSVNSPQKRQSPFFDSVPSTPAYGSYSADNVFTKDSPFGFADSVPSTPMHNSNSPREEQYSFENSFSRFDSFNINDSGPFDSSLSRFDSMRSTRDSEFDRGSSTPRDSFVRFDSFRSTAESYYNFGPFPPRESTLTRFDSMSSTRDSEYGHGFASFDDTADPFGSSEPFRSSHEAQTPKRDSDI